MKIFMYLMSAENARISNTFRYISNKMQLYTIYLFLENCSTYFWWYLHPSSGAHTFFYSIWHLSNRYFYLTLWRQVAVTVLQVPVAVGKGVCS